jgi:alkanesulfonate monooxygenase
LSAAADGPPALGVCFGWNRLPFEDLVALARHAERRGFRAVYLDGDVSTMPSRGEGDVLEGWTATVALLARTERIEVGSIRLVHHWPSAARLAQAVATVERLFPGRLRVLASVGGHPRLDAGFGLPAPPAAERVAWLGETLEAARALWRGETVSRRGTHVRLDEARVRPCPPAGRPWVEVGGRRARLLEVAARHADGWDVNLPPVRHRVMAAAAQAEAACRRVGRDPATLARSMWILVRPHGEPGDPALAEAFRRWCPWFAWIPDAELGEAVVAGPPERARARLAALARDLRLALPVADLTGLDPDAARRALDALAPSPASGGGPSKSDVDSGVWRP